MTSLNYNPALREFAANLRKSMTKAEACLWKFILRRRMLKGYTFKRQRPVLNYIADFYCEDLLLIIEVDGITHEWDEVAEKDRIRQEALENAGYTVLRFPDEDVLNDIDHILFFLEDWIEAREKEMNLPVKRRLNRSIHPPPSPRSSDPPPRGGG